MDTTVKERLLSFIEFRGLSKNKFETMCGLSTRYVSNISQSISPVVAKKISLKFPELNMGWVLTGEGEMLSQAGEQRGKNDEGIVLTGEAMKIFLNMSSTISRQEENISKLTDMVNRLTGGGKSAPQKGSAV